MPENHPLYLGVYGGAMSSDADVRKYVEASDCVLMLGTFITDMNMGIYTAKLDRTRTILATTDAIRVQFHRYEDVEFKDFLERLAKAGVPAKGFARGKRPASSQAAGQERADRSADDGGGLPDRLAAPG